MYELEVTTEPEAQVWGERNWSVQLRYCILKEKMQWSVMLTMKYFQAQTTDQAVL